MDDRSPYDFSLKELEKLSTGVVKKAFRYFRQLLIIMLYAVAVFFVLNDFSLRLDGGFEFASSKLPWLVLYVLAHYFCRDYGIQKGRDDDDFIAVNKSYNEACVKLRYRRREFEEYCRELERYYTDIRRRAALERLGATPEQFDAVSASTCGSSCDVITTKLKRALKKLKKLEKKKPLRITYDTICSRADTYREKDGADAPIKLSFERYMRRRSLISVAKIVIFSFFTFSLTATLGSDPISDLVAGVPYLATMLSVSVTSMLGAYRSVITYDVDRLSDRISIISGFLDRDAVL